MRQLILEIKNVIARYGDAKVLHDVSLSVYPSEVIGIVGQSGSGKTSLLNCILQLEPNLKIDAGEILYTNQKLLDMNQREYRQLFKDEIAQRVAVSLALMNDPKLLLCDEPTSALDVKSAYEMVQQLKRLKEEKGMTMVVITHNIALAAQLCNRIAVMYQGRIVEVQETNTLIKNPMHAYTKELLAALPKTEDLWDD